MTTNTEKLLCPKCGQGGLVNAGQSRGKQRFKHANRTKVACKWNGTDPISIAEGFTPGVPAYHIKRMNKILKHLRKTGGRFVITAAQNATPVWEPFLHTLLTYCRETKAQLLVIPYRYKNPTSMWTESQQNEDWWDKKLESYLYDQRFHITQNVMIMGDIKTQPTASRPLQGFESMSGAQSAIFGHPKLALKTVPTPQTTLPKMIVTTGSVTQKNYTPTKAGKKGAFHHTFGATVLETTKDGTFFMRQLNADQNGHVCDLNYFYTPSGREEVQVEALIMGDTHVDFADPKAVKATFGPGQMVDTLKPKVLVWHDVLDFYAATHHHMGRVFTLFAKHHAGRTNIEEEIRRCFEFVDRYSPASAKNLFVYSNHSDMLQRWVNRTDPRTDPENALFWAHTFYAMAAGTKLTETGTYTIDPFAYWAEQYLNCWDRSKFLKMDESYTIKGIELGQHGHAGPSGTKGTLHAFTKIGVKSIIGHSHVPGIDEGAYQVGTTSYLKAEYTQGPTAWMHSHCAIYANGKRSLLIIVDGKWKK